MTDASLARAACAESAALVEADADVNGLPELAKVCEAIAAARLGDVAMGRSLIARFEKSRPAKPLYRPY